MIQILAPEHFNGKVSRRYQVTNRQGTEFIIGVVEKEGKFDFVSVYTVAKGMQRQGFGKWFYRPEEAIEKYKSIKSELALLIYNPTLAA